MKSRSSSNAPMYVCKFQRAIVASAIAVFLGACAGGTEEGAANGSATDTTPEIGAAVETDTDLVVTGSGSDVEVTPDVDSTDIDTVVDESEGVQTDVEGEVDSTIDVSEGVQTDVEGEVDQTTDTVDIPEVDSTDSIPDNALGLIQAHPELGLFATAIQSSGLVGYLADPGQRVTVFALSNKAFESLSTIQRDALFNDPDRLSTLVRSTTIHDTRITASTAGVVDDTQALSNGSLTIEREGDVISVATSAYYSTVAVKVTSTLVSDEVAIHIIDDFINIPATFFPPDPGSIMERLLADSASRFSDYIRVTRWYRELGNSEGEWTVFVPSVFSTSDIEPYIVASTANGPIIIEAGTLTSVDGSSHVIENVDGAWTFDNREISEFYALEVNNGHVHRLAWPLGEYGHPLATPGFGGSVYDLIYTSSYHTSLLAAIDAAGMADMLDDEALQFTVFAPDDAAFEALNTDEAPTAMKDLMADTDLLTGFLQYHIVEGTVNSQAFENAPQEVTLPTLLEGQSVTATPSATAPSGLAIDGVDILASDLVAESETTSGVVHWLGAVLDPYKVVDPPVPVGGETGPVLTAMQNDADGFSNVLAALGSITIKLDENDSAEDPWTIFAPTDAALGEYGGVFLSDMVYVGPRQTPADLFADADGVISTFDGSKTYAIGGTDEASLTIGGAPAILLGGGTSITYKLTAVPVAN